MITPTNVWVQPAVSRLASKTNTLFTARLQPLVRLSFCDHESRSGRVLHFGETSHRMQVTFQVLTCSLTMAQEQW